MTAVIQGCWWQMSILGTRFDQQFPRLSGTLYDRHQESETGPKSRNSPGTDCFPDPSSWKMLTLIFDVHPLCNGWIQRIRWECLELPQHNLGWCKATVHLKRSGSMILIDTATLSQFTCHAKFIRSKRTMWMTLNNASSMWHLHN